MFAGLLQGTSVSSLFKSSRRARGWIVFVLVVLQASCWETVVWHIELTSFFFVFVSGKCNQAFKELVHGKVLLFFDWFFLYLTFRESLHDNLPYDNKRMKECKKAVLLFCLAGSIWNLQTILSNTSASKTCDLDFFVFIENECSFVFQPSFKRHFYKGKEELMITDLAFPFTGKQL